MSNINITVKVDNTSASARLKQLHTQVKKVGNAASTTRKSFKDFNQTMFGATAFVGMFTQAFQGLANVMMAGSELDRASRQFANRFGSELPAQMKKFDNGTEAVIGPQGRFIQNIRAMTTNSIDMMAAMRSAIQLRSSGVTGDIDTLSEIVVRAGTAAKMAGKDSAEGIRRVTDFLKDGSLAHLQHLGLLREVNPELKAQLAILGKATGVLGTAVTSTYKLALGMKILRAATKGQLKGQRDLRDTLQDTAQYFDILKGTVGTFLGTAIQPLLESFIDFSLQATMILEDIKNNKKEILFLAKAFIIGSAAVAGFVLVIGGLRLAMTALTSLVGGIPFLTVALSAMAAAVLYNKTSMQGLVDIAQTLGAVVQGSFQLIHSFLSDPENFAKGIGKMDKSIHDLLKSKGLLGLVTNISRVGSIVTVFVQSTVRGFMTALDGMLNKLGSVGTRIKSFLGLDSGPWKRDWLDTAKSLGEAFGKVSLSLLGLWGLFKLIKGGKSLFSGGGLLGGLFKDKAGKAPKGTSGDPIYVKMKNKIMSGGLIGEMLTHPKGKKAGLAAGLKTVGGKLGHGARKLLLAGMISSPMLTKIIGGITRTGPKAAALAGMIRFPAMAKVADVGLRAGSSLKAGGSKTLGFFKKLFKPLEVVLRPLTSLFGSFVPFLGRILATVGRFTPVSAIIATVGTFLYGFVEGLIEAKDGISKFVSGVTTWVKSLFETSPFLKKVKSGLIYLYDALAMLFNKIREWGKSLGIVMGDALGAIGQAAHDAVLRERDTRARKIHEERGTSLLPTEIFGFGRGSARDSMIPNMPQNEDTRQATIYEALEQVSGAEKTRMQEAFNDAISINSPDGLTITREEWEDIFAGGMDKSKKVAELAKDNKDTKKNTDKGVIGSAREGVC